MGLNLGISVFLKQIDTRIQAISISNQHCDRGPGYAIRQAGIMVFILKSNKNFQLPKNEPNEKYIY